MHQGDRARKPSSVHALIALMAISLRPLGTGRVIASAAALDFRSRRVTVSNHEGCVRPDRRLQQGGLPVSPAPPKAAGSVSVALAWGSPHTPAMRDRGTVSALGRCP